MTALLAIALWAPTFEVGATVGPGVVDDSAALLATPWGGFQTGPFEVALQAPLRFDLAEGQLREEDWDEVADAGRVLRFARYGEAIGVGILSDLTLGHGTLVSRYHGGTDDDTHRVGALVTIEDAAFGGLLFVDQLFGPPVVGARIHARPLTRLEVGLTGVTDTAAPESPDGQRDDRDTSRVVAYGGDVAFELAESLWVYADGNMLHDAPGAHLGIEGEHRDRPWRLRGRLEGFWATAEYDPFRFDLGYLVDRWRRPPPDRSAVGGRVSAEVSYAEALRIGGEYSDADAPDRAGLTLWMRIPDERVRVTGLFRTRGPRDELVDPEQALAALVVRVQVHPVWSLGLTLARVWRAPVDGGALEPGTDAALVAEAAWGW